MTKEPLFREKQRFFFIKLLASFALRFAALLFFENASGGGTDIVAMIIKKYSTMNISGALFAVDCVIVVVSFMVFDLTTGLCSVL